MSAIASFGFAFWSLNQLTDYLRRRKRGFANQDDIKIEATLRSWLDKWRFKISRDAQPNMLFQFKAEDNLGCVMLVARPKDVNSFILIGGIWNIPPELETQFNSMPDNMRMDMLENLQIEMLRLGVSYIGLDTPLKKVGIEIRVPCDENCTESVFLREFQKARYAYLLMTTIMRKSLRHAGYVPKPLTPDKEDSQT